MPDMVAAPRLREFRFALSGAITMPARPCSTTPARFTDHDVVESLVRNLRWIIWRERDHAAAFDGWIARSLSATFGYRQRISSTAEQWMQRIDHHRHSALVIYWMTEPVGSLS